MIDLNKEQHLLDPKEWCIDQMAADAMTRQEMISGATPDDATANQIGVSTASATNISRKEAFA